MQVRTTARRLATVGALGVPLAFAATGLASATEPGHASGECGGAVASQEGGLVGVDGGVDPALNLGSVLGNGPTSQSIVRSDQSNSGIVQSGGGCTNHDLDPTPVAFQSADAVRAALDVSPALNVGGIGGGPVDQTIVREDASNRGILQSGGGFASQQGGLLGLNLDVSPAINLGGILSGPTQQSIAHVDRSNSGIVQG
jgi:hypothetical protein